MSIESPELNKNERSLSEIELLQKGEIESVENYEDFYHIQRVKIKDDGLALFKKESTDEDDHQTYALSEYETLAQSLNNILSFNLVPASAKRNIGEASGVLQRFIEEAKPAASLENWRLMVNQDELLRAAVFDTLINAKDRHEGNFLIDEKTGKLWLIDHDYFMFEDYLPASYLTIEVRGKKIPQEVLLVLSTLIQKTNSLLETPSSQSDIQKSFWIRVRDNAQLLLTRGTI